MLEILWVLVGLAFQPARPARPAGPPAPPPAPAPAVVHDLTHNSQAMNGPRVYQAILPGAYATSQKRYPVIYWLHGYEQTDAAREAEIAAFVTTHDAIVIKAGPVETTGPFAMYLPELTDHIDRTLRTVADRDHRGVTGYAIGGFMALWLAAKYPDLVGRRSGARNRCARSGIRRPHAGFSPARICEALAQAGGIPARRRVSQFFGMALGGAVEPQTTGFDRS